MVASRVVAGRSPPRSRSSTGAGAGSVQSLRPAARPCRSHRRTRRTMCPGVLSWWFGIAVHAGTATTHDPPQPDPEVGSGGGGAGDDLVAVVRDDALAGGDAALGLVPADDGGAGGVVGHRDGGGG